MNKLKKSQILMLCLLAILLTIAPLLSSSSRPTYLYFITNLLIIILGAEAGLLSFFLKPSDHKKNASSDPKPCHSIEAEEKAVPPDPSETAKARAVEKCTSEKIMGSARSSSTAVVERVKKCPSMPSLFFIGGEGAVEDDEDREEEMNGQELFAKAETFIGNFYKQLKMQREESWRRIHGFYQRAF